MGCDPFERRVIRLRAGSCRPYQASEWDDALVIVAEGELELEGLSGCRWSFPRGAILWLTDLPVRALHNRGDQGATLIAVTRPMSSRSRPRPS